MACEEDIFLYAGIPIEILPANCSLGIGSRSRFCETAVRVYGAGDFSKMRHIDSIRFERHEAVLRIDSAHSLSTAEIEEFASVGFKFNFVKVKQMVENKSVLEAHFTADKQVHPETAYTQGESD